MQNLKSYISVIITCYNEEQFIAETIASVLAQTELNLISEIVVVNDGSKDNSEKNIKELAEKNSLIKYVYQDNKGLAAARNTAIKNTTGNYIAILDGDDLWMPEKLKIVSGYINQDPVVGLFYSNVYEYFYQTGKLKELRVNKYHSNQENLLQNFLAKGGPIVPSSVIIKKECFDNVGLFDESFRMAEDTDMWLRIASAFSFQFIPDFLVKKRQVVNSLGSNTIENAKYYKLAFDKAEKNNPALKPFRDAREKIIHYKLGLYYYRINEFKNARKEAKESIKKGTSSLKVYLLLVSTFLKPNLKIDLIQLFKKI